MDDKYLEEMLSASGEVDEELKELLGSDDADFMNMLGDIVTDAKLASDEPEYISLSEDELKRLEEMESESEGADSNSNSNNSGDDNELIQETPLDKKALKEQKKKEKLEKKQKAKQEKLEKKAEKKKKKEKASAPEVQAEGVNDVIPDTATEPVAEASDLADIKEMDAPEEADKKGKKGKKDKKAKKEKAPKEPKEKKSFKQILTEMLFEEVEDEETPADLNQAIIDEMYGDEEGEEGGKGKKGKKGKKAKKEKKPKKEKAPKVKKEKKPKEPIDPKDKLGFNPIKVVIFVTFVASVVLLVMVWTGAFNYYNNMSESKKYYKAGNYKMAYECVAGMEVKDKDSKYYSQLRQVMYIDKQLNSYYQFKKLGDGIKSFDSLLKGVKVHVDNSENDKKLGVYDITSKKYEEIIKLLQEEYMVSEKDAIYYSSLENYAQYYEILKIYGGAE